MVQDAFKNHVASKSKPRSSNVTSLCRSTVAEGTEYFMVLCAIPIRNDFFDLKSVKGAWCRNISIARNCNGMVLK